MSPQWYLTTSTHFESRTDKPDIRRKSQLILQTPSLLFFKPASTLHLSHTELDLRLANSFTPQVARALIVEKTISAGITFDRAERRHRS